jgi:carbamoyltransferase
MKILGISAFYHDSAAALVIDGRLVAAASEERFSRIKHDPELPVHVVTFCLDRAQIGINDLDCVVFYDKPLSKFDRILTGYMATPVHSYRAFITALPVWLRRKLWVDHVIHKETGFDGEVLYLPHHLSHAAGTFFESPFDKAAILTVDGVGEWATASIGIGDNNHVRLIKEMHYPHSVGLLYSAFTYYLGFMVNSSEYKVMGLAPYGEPVYADLIKEKLVSVHDDGSIHLNMKYFTYHHSLTMTGKRFADLFGRRRRLPDDEIETFHRNVAASVQQVTEEIMVKMATYARDVTGLDRLCLSGGVALNCKANGLLLKQGIFDDIYAQPASGDAGGAAGAALYAYHRLTGDDKHFQPFFGVGPAYSDDDIRAFLDAHDIPYTSGEAEDLAAGLAKEVAAGKIVALFDGAMEFGPRALGFRSIVADPRDNRMKEKINAAVKYREAFRPFAPAVLKERVSEYFDCDGTSPYMLFNFTVRDDKRSVIPAVTHVDNSSRIQTIARYDNPVLYRLIEAFDGLTGVPVVLNTSFNLRGHPIVNTPEEAFATFCSGGIDFLLIGSFLLDKGRLSENLVRAFAVEKKPD